MKFAPMNYHYLRYPLTKFLDKVERSPFDSIDLYCSAPQLNLFDHPLSHLLELDGELRRRHLSVAAMTPENCVYPVNFCTQDRITRESSLRYYQRAIDTAEFLGCPRVQIITSRDIAKMLDEIDSPAVVGMVDMDQMTYAGETVADYFANLGSRMQYVHFNDRGHTVPGDGDFPMKDYYEQIKAQGYDGCCSFEICDRRYYIDPDKAIDDTVAWMRANTHELD